MSALRAMSPRPSRSHCTTAPPMNTLPSSAYSLTPSMREATVVNKPWPERATCVPVCMRMKQPVP
jgi:hypothetical protein